MGQAIPPVESAGRILATRNKLKMNDLTEPETLLGETLADLGPVSGNGDVADGVGSRLAETANGGDEYRAGLARYALGIMDRLAGVAG